MPAGDARSVAVLLERISALLDAKGVPEAEANAEFLLAAVLGRGRMEARIWPRRALTGRQVRLLLRLAKLRSRRVPLAYVLGTQPFLDIDIRVTPAVLIPRPETEELVQAVSELARSLFSPEPLRVLEIGTGSGCISIALAARFKSAVLCATDISPAALRLAKYNARRHRFGSRIRFLREDMLKSPDPGVKAWADILVSNPPYIPSALVPLLEPEVLKEPRLALDGGEDGLDAVRAIVARARRVLKPGGWLALEFGYGQAAEIRSMLGDFHQARILKDCSGFERFALAQRPKTPFAPGGGK